MTQPAADLALLSRQVWHAPLPDPAAPEQDLHRALRQGAPYDAVKTALHRLHRLALPGSKVSAQAQARWPNSIDMALLAFDLALPEQKVAALAQLDRCVQQQNRRRAALAGAYLRAQRPTMAQQVLAQTDLSSPTARDDIHRRAEFALSQGEFLSALADIDWLEQNGAGPASAVLKLKLTYRRDGAAALPKWLDECANPSAALWAQAFHIFMSEGDFQNGPDVLVQWQASPSPDATALSRALTRLALETGDIKAAQALLDDRLQAQPPWHWQAADHVQWLRARQLAQRDAAELLEHACAACRTHARHDWLHHLCRVLREGVADWRDLAHDKPAPSSSTETALIAARAALRMGLSGQAARALAPARRAAFLPQDLHRLHCIRAEAFWVAGRVEAATIAHRAATLCATDAVQRAEGGMQGAELALLQGDPEKAKLMLAPIAKGFAQRMALPLTQARISFMQGDFAAAMAEHARFNALKLAQTGTPAPPDVRDRIVEDADTAARGIESVFAPDLAVTESIAKAGLARIIAAPGLSACLLRRAHVRGELQFQPDAAAQIPRRIVHYWQGPPGPALMRAQQKWAQLHPDFDQHLFDDATATAWLRKSFAPDMAARFEALGHAALRADLFRLCWVLRQGGIFTDLDEYPRIPVTSWLKDARAVLCIERGFGTIANNFIAAQAEHPVCALALDFVCTALDQPDAPYAWWHSGPAQWTRAAFAHQFGAGGTDVRFLSQAQYCRRVATNLPYPHKRSPDHWR